MNWTTLRVISNWYHYVCLHFFSSLSLSFCFIFVICLKLIQTLKNLWSISFSSSFIFFFEFKVFSFRQNVIMFSLSLLKLFAHIGTKCLLKTKKNETDTWWLIYLRLCACNLQILTNKHDILGVMMIPKNVTKQF